MPEPSLFFAFCVFIVKVFFVGGSEAELVREVSLGSVIDRLAVQVLIGQVADSQAVGATICL